MPLSVHHVEGLCKVVMRVKFCTYSGCGLTNDFNKSTGFKTINDHLLLTMNWAWRNCWYLINDSNVWIIHAIKKVLIYYLNVSQLWVVIEDSKRQLFYLIVVYVPLKRIRLEFIWELSKISQPMFKLLFDPIIKVWIQVLISHIIVDCRKTCKQRYLVDLASQELDSLSHRFVSTVFVFHLLPFGHYVCLVLKIFNFSVFPPYAMWLNVISINLMQLSKRGTFVETAYPRLPSNRRTRQSVELFTSVADERTHDSVCKFCLMLCKILNRDLLNVFGFGSHHRNSFSNFKPCFED